jgi:transposase
MLIANEMARSWVYPWGWLGAGDVSPGLLQQPEKGTPMTHDYHIGVDYHKAYSYIVVQDSAGKKLRCGRVDNSQQAVERFLEPFDGKRSHAVVEATRNWTVMFDLLEPICDEVLLANPLKVKAIAEAKIKTDKIDATILSHLLRTDLLPTAHVPSASAREMRQVLPSL